MLNVLKELKEKLKQKGFISSKKGVIQQMVGMAIGIVVLSVAAVIGTVVLTQLGDSVGGTANTSAVYAAGYLGSGTGGLLTWLPVIIPAVIGIGIIGYFLVLRGQKY